LEGIVEALQPFAVSMPEAEFVIIEMFGGDNNLSPFVTEDLKEMAAGIGPRSAVIGLADLAGAPGAVVEVTQRGGVKVLEQAGEIDTGDPDILMRFLARALITYPNARKAIGFWDHGTGVFDETDNSEKLATRRAHSVARAERSRSFPARRLFFPKAKLESEPATRAMLHDDTNGGVLTNLEAAHMLADAFKAAGQTSKIDVLFSDTCLNGMIEVSEQLGPFAHCVVGSPELEPGDGWDYRGWFELTAQQPPATPAEWGQQAVTAFKRGYEPYPKKHPCTLGAFHSDQRITAAFAALLQATRAGGHETFFLLDHARARSQDYARRDAYDLRDFALQAEQVFTQSGKPAIAAAARDLTAAFDAARVDCCLLGPTVTRSSGLAFWFPASRSALSRDMRTYERLAFSKKSGWGDFLKEFR
jgi:hypothetical protein